jgi:hypothetical protein
LIVAVYDERRIASRAVRAIAAIDAAHGMGVLRAAARAKHPQVRLQAIRALASLTAAKAPGD